MGNVLIERLHNVFGPPDRSENPEAFVAELHRITAGFSPDALDQAASVLIADGGKFWPAPKAIVQACVDAQEALAIRHGRLQPKERMPWDDAAEKGEKWAREFCRSTEIGQRAFSEGWGKNLYQWAKSYAQENYNRDMPPNPSQCPAPFEIEHWVRYCTSPSAAKAHPSVRNPIDFTELERVTYRREPFSAETNARLNRRLSDLRERKPFTLPAFKQMPTEDDAA